MFEGLGQILENFITDLSFRRFMIYGILVIMVIGSIIIYEKYTGHFKLTRLEKTTELIDRLYSIQESENFNEDKKLREIYSGVKSELLLLTLQGQNIYVVNPLVWRGLLSGSLWILLALSTIPGIRRNEEGKMNELKGYMIFTIPSIIVGLILPSNWQWYILYLIYPFGHFIIIAAFLVFRQNRKSKANISE